MCKINVEEVNNITEEDINEAIRNEFREKIQVSRFQRQLSKAFGEFEDRYDSNVKTFKTSSEWYKENIDLLIKSHAFDPSCDRERLKTGYMGALWCAEVIIVSKEELNGEDFILEPEYDGIKYPLGLGEKNNETKA